MSALVPFAEGALNYGWNHRKQARDYLWSHRGDILRGAQRLFGGRKRKFKRKRIMGRRNVKQRRQSQLSQVQASHELTVPPGNTGPSIDERIGCGELKVALPFDKIKKTGTVSAGYLDQYDTRTGNNIHVSGFRIQYCVRRTYPTTGNSETLQQEILQQQKEDWYLKMVMVEDKMPQLEIMNKKQQDNSTRDDEEAYGYLMFSSMGHRGEGTQALDVDYSRAGINFKDLKPECTTVVHPINSDRYKVLGQKTFKFSPETSSNTRIGKVWIPYKKQVKFMDQFGDMSPDVYTDKNVALLYWVENAAGTRATKDDNYINFDLKIMTYFRNLRNN